MDLKKTLVLFLLSCIACNLFAQKSDQWLKELLMDKASPLLKHVLNNPDSFQYQVIYTEINRDKKNKASFKHHFLNVDRNRYYNPASTVKLPTALVALEKLNEMGIDGVNRYTTMITDSSFNGQTAVRTDTSSGTGLPSIANYIKKIFLVSDNDAYNRLYEFAGQEKLNTSLWKKGYNDVRIVRRFVTATEEQNRNTNAIRFVSNGKTIYTQPAAYNPIAFDYSKTILVGKGHFDRNDSLINAPMDFTKHNNLPLEDLQQLLQSVLFPESVPAKKRFNLTKDDERFLLRYMSELPSESKKPGYSPTEFFDSYCKFFLYKATKQKPPPNIRIFNKPGWSYGYLTDSEYIVDFDTNTEFMISAVIYVNRDGILNDDKYEYKEIGYPFFKEVGEIILQYDQNRKRAHKPDLSKFRIDYRADHE
ncbi:serine hydrolase [Sediminibacterium roseum]|uniref:Serine hydrolase n=1 Tax=Sediminibacterium roseum TaxID=1978412 RepID=A0ABW9ZU66_9BACT|nr:serine hydrolase [Sediminibacterium roseum]NCI50696.1 serine hydrolase [Sediminibacterium roseum]